MNLNKQQSEKYLEIVRRGNMDDMFDFGRECERQAVIKEIEEMVLGMMWMYEHQGFTGKRVCENCKEVVEAGSPCAESKYYEEWKRLAELRAKLAEMKGKTV